MVKSIEKKGKNQLWEGKTKSERSKLEKSQRIKSMGG